MRSASSGVNSRIDAGERLLEQAPPSRSKVQMACAGCSASACPPAAPGRRRSSGASGWAPGSRRVSVGSNAGGVVVAVGVLFLEVVFRVLIRGVGE